MDYKPTKVDGGLTEPLQGQEPSAIVGAQYCLPKAEQFTLNNARWTKDWTITNANGQELFRVRGKKVDWFRPQRELVDLDGNSLVMMKQKPWSFPRSWQAFEPGKEEHPLWTIKKLTFCSFKPRLAIFLPSSTDRKTPNYTIKGVFMCKKCLIYFGDRKVAEVVREASLKNILTRKSIFHVIVQPGVDTAFIFSLIVTMDRLYIHGHYNHGTGAGGSS